MGSMDLGSLAYVVARVGGRWRLRSATIALLLSSIVAVGLSRVYLGVHWISDIAAGYAAGLGVAGRGHRDVRSVLEGAEDPGRYKK